MVLVQFGLIPVEGGVLARCLISTAEYADTRHTRAMEYRADAEGRVVATRHLPVVSPDDEDTRWIGVEPLTELTAEVLAEEIEQ